MVRDKEPNARIMIENKVDYGPAPENFTYITKSFARGIEIASTPLLYCTCSENCNGSKTCCDVTNQTKMAYDDQKRLRLLKKTSIIECNSMCSCTEDCCNRVVQLGIKVPLCIFTTKTGRGWGVKGMKKIPRYFNKIYWI